MPDWVICPLPLLGPSILKTFLDEKGYKTDLADISIRVRYLNRFSLRKIIKLELFKDRERIINFLKDHQDDYLKKEITKLINLGNLTNYDVIGFSLYDNSSIAFVLCIAKILKEEYGKKIVLGGPIVSRSDFTDLLNFDFIDFLIVGDGEEPLLKVLNYFEGKGTIENCDGIFYRKAGKIHTAKPSIFSLENKSIPTFNTEDLKLYRKLNQNGLLIIPYLLTRGCRFKCAFCSEYENTSFRYALIEKVISDIKNLLSTYHANSIYFAEANLNNDHKYLIEFSKRIIREGLKFSWGGFCTIDSLDENTIKIMAKSGCRYVLLGIESASEPMLKKMQIRKASDVEKFKGTLKLLNKHGIRVHYLFVVEFPYETNEDFRKDIDFINETAKYTTTAAGCIFELLENSIIFLVPKTFDIQIRQKGASRYNFFDRFWEFDETSGLKWEDKYKRGRIKVELINKIIFNKIESRLIFKSFIKDPLYLIKKKISHPYTSYDVYFI